MTDLLTSKEQVGAHHCTSEAIAALLADLDAIGECREFPPLQDRDHRAMAGVVACVIRHLQGVGVRLAVEKFNLKGELREAQSANRALPHRQSRPVPRAWAGNVDDAALHDLQINRPGALHVIANASEEIRAPETKAPRAEGPGVCYCGEYGGGVHTKSARCAPKSGGES